MRNHPASAQIAAGRHSYGSPKILWWGERAKLKIGDYCSLSGDATIFLGGNHHYEWLTTYPFGSAPAKWPDAPLRSDPVRTNGDVTIGNDVWVGRGATIMSGVTIADGAVVGAEALVAKDVSAYSIVGGNPAKVLKYRFTEQEIEALLRISWWNWSEEKISNALPTLLSGQIGDFIAAHDPLLLATSRKSEPGSLQTHPKS